MLKLFSVNKNEELSEENQENLELEKKELGQLSLDIIETPSAFVILSPVAGIDLADINLSYNDGVLTIKGDRKKPDIFSEEIEVKNSECYWGEFIRNIMLPENLDFDNIDATMENNLLVVTIRKLSFDSQHIKINRTI